MVGGSTGISPSEESSTLTSVSPLDVVLDLETEPALTAVDLLFDEVFDVTDLVLMRFSSTFSCIAF